MPFPPAINEALENYDKNKGFWRRLFRRDQAAIRALRRLNETDQANFLKLYRCFIENKPKLTQESYQVYQALLNYLASLDCQGIPDTLDQLHSNQLLNSINLEELNQLTGDHFRKFAILLNHLNAQNLLTQLNFDNITTYFENSEENISEILSIILTSVDKLHQGNSLTQVNLKCLLKKPLQAENMANILLLLDQNCLLTSENRIQLNNEKNELLLTDKAYRAIWHPLKDYLSNIVNIHEKQRVFNHLICLTQKEEEIEEIKKYVNDLISEAKPARRYTFDKFSTAPSLRIKRSRVSVNLRDRLETL
jgi:hypothetical protein